MAQVWKGAEVTAALNRELAERIEKLKMCGVSPRLAIVRMGENDGDMAYERNAIKRCESLGISVECVALDASAAEETLLRAIRSINDDASIHGCLLLRPLPKHINDAAARNALRPEKDVDGITDASLAGVFANEPKGFPPCTAAACMQLLRHYGCAPEGKRAVVIGRSLVVGRPVAMLLMHQNATVTVCHTKTKDLPNICREADILIVSAGRAELINAAAVRAGQCVIDAGIHVGPDGRLCGDVQFSEVEPVVSAITPVPGGVGAVTTAILAKHVAEAAERTLS